MTTKWPSEIPELKVFLVDIVTKDTKRDILEDRMRELENLVQTYGGVVILQTYQKKDQPDNRTYVWKGKLEEIIADMQRLGANLLIIGNILKPRQVYELSEMLRPLKIEVRDRVDLILQIFDKHADSIEAKMQVELAAIKHMWPRILNMGKELWRQGWAGSGAMRGLGETNTEIMKRHLKDKQLKIAKKLEEYEHMRKLHREWRAKKWFPVVGIVWYTNSWKSTLLNTLTKKWVLAENKLFATLWTNVGKLYIITDPATWLGREILFNDTIGFIRDLPPQLIQAFRSTLEDSIESDILFHVVDSSDPFFQERINVVNEILDKIWAKQERILVFNKIDLLDELQLATLKYEFKNETCLWISALEEKWLEELKDLLIEKTNSINHYRK